MMNPYNLCQALENSIDNLSLFLSKEDDYVRHHDFKLIEENLPKKNDLCQTFEYYLEKVATPEVIEELSPQDRLRLKTKISLLKNKMISNREALELAKDFNNKLIKLCLTNKNEIKIKNYNYKAEKTERDALVLSSFSNEV